METNHDDQDDHVIEVPAGDFYEGVEAEASFLASLHAFPLKELNGPTSAPQVPARERPFGQPKGATGIASPAVPAYLANKKFQIHHTGKTRLRPTVPLEDKECLATWVTVGGLDAWTLWDPHVLQLGTVGSRSIIKYGADAPVMVGKVNTTSYVDIANFDRYDMIIGTPWMRKHKVLLDFDTNRVIINGVAIPAIKVKEKDLDLRLRRHRTTDRRKPE